jgi:hypothetical protein
MSTGKPAYVYTGSEWIPIGLIIGAKYQSASPVATGTGDIWIDSDDQKIYVYNGTSWVESAYLTRDDGLTQSSASSLYLTQSSASSTYLNQSSASTTYARINSPSFTGTANFTSASVAFNSASISGLGIPNPNLLYNGAMQVHQRGTSTAGLTGTSVNAYYTADRWKFSTGDSNGTYTQTIENDAPTGSGFRKSLKMLCTDTNSMLPSGGTKDLICQTLEGFDVQSIRKGSASAQQVTLSFWIKSNATKTLIIELEDIDNSRYVSASCGTSSSQTWEYKTITFPADTTGVLDNDNNGSLQLNIWLAGGSTYGTGGTSSPGSLSNLQTTWGTTASARAPGLTLLTTTQYIQFTGVKLEVGSSATAYQFKSYGQELGECQRYHYRITGDTYTRYGSGFNNTTTTGQGVVFLPVTMRAAPSSITTTGTASNYAVFHGAGTITACSAVPTLGTSGVTSTTVTLVFTVASGLTAGGACQIISNNNTSVFIGFNAEL